jgi:hypothetical protein
MLDKYGDSILWGTRADNRAQYLREIEELRASLQVHKSKFESAVTGVTSEAPVQRSEIEKIVHRIEGKLDSIENQQKESRKAFESLRLEALSHYSVAEKEFITRLLEELDLDQLTKVLDLLKRIDEVDINRLEETVASLQDSLHDICEQGVLNVPGEDRTDLTEALADTSLDIAHKAKITIPIIPFLFKYEGEIKTKSGLDITKLWELLTHKLGYGKKPPSNELPSS